jgi:hypothetical protein
MNGVSIYFEYVLIWLRLRVLEQARDGGLSPTWRDDLPPSNLALGSGAVVEAVEMAVKEIRQMPYAAWEPEHAPDWRTALDAWYIDSRGLLTHSYAGNSHRLTANMFTNDDVVSYGVRSRAPTDESASVVRLLTCAMSIDETADQARNRLGQSYTQTRDWLTAAYLAGLAAGGQDTDWIEWFKTRVAQWPPDEPATRGAKTELNHPAFREKLERLPTYWIS